MEMNFHVTVSPRKPDPPSTTMCLCLEEFSRLVSGSVHPKPGVPSTVGGVSRASLSPRSNLWFRTSKLWWQSVSTGQHACADARRPNMSQPSPMMLVPLSVLYNADPTHQLLLSHTPRLSCSQQQWQRAGQSGRQGSLSQLQ